MPVSINRHSIWPDRIDGIRARAKAQLSRLGMLEKQQRLLTRHTLILIADTKAKISDRARSSDQYTRSMPRTLWSDKFDESKSPINLPITGQLLRVFAKKLGAPKPWSAGYLMALAVLELFDQLCRSDISDTAGFNALDNVFEQEEEIYTFIEAFLGKAEEAIYKADVLSEQARHGEISQRPADQSWESRIDLELSKMGGGINQFRFHAGEKAGKINRTRLAERLFALIGSDHPPSQFPKNATTIRRRLPDILGRLNITDK